MLRDDRDRLGAEMNRRAEADRNTIDGLNREIYDSRGELGDKDSHLAKLKSELQDLISAADAKTSDIHRLSGDLSSKTDLGSHLLADRDDRSRQLNIEIDNNKVLRADLDRLNADLNGA